jgi:hypothetical protein
MQEEGTPMQQTTRTIRAAILAGAILCFSTMAALATEGGGGAYPNGAEDFLSGAAPPPGTYLINYLTHYRADRFTDDSGDKLMPDFKLRATADVVRIIHMTDKQLLGATWGMHMFVPIVYLDVESSMGDDSAGGLGDIIVDPLILAWHSKNFHVTTGLDIYLPTGRHNANRLANPGRNYWTFEPVVGVTWLGDTGLQASVKAMYDFNTKNDDTGYRSGQEFHADWALGQKLGAYTVGAAGYWYQQTTDDRNDNGGTLDRGRSIALGPVLRYDYRNMAFTLKYLIETDTRNRPEGDNLWFKFLYAF